MIDPTRKNKDNIEQVKQKVLEIQKVLVSTIIPRKNHTLFEVNLLLGSIEVAEFDAVPVLKWEDAIKGLYHVNKKLTTKPNCIYISSLNVENVVKILKRDHKIILNPN
jgi:hypothetical protein